jgi:tetratricopeptide (TPR) repeat protein
MPNRLLVEELSEGQVQVGFRRAGQDFDEVAGQPVPFSSPFEPAEREDLRWYLEDYLIAPFAVYEQRGQAVQAKLAQWGRALFDGVFGAGKPGRDAYLKSREGECELVLRSHSPAFLSLPWELLQDPERSTPLALELSSIDRTLIAAGAAAPVPPGEVLRVLMVIARPAGLQDVGYQMIARPLMERLSAVRGQVELEVLRPPTLEALTDQLKAAADRPYHILHFDGHGTFGVRRTGGSGQHQFDGETGARGYLAFEAEGGGHDLVPAEEFALAVNQARVPLVVLNACRSGMMSDVAVEAAVATRLLEGGAASVVAMGYSVYAVAAAEFMTAFYEALFARKSVSEAVSEGRRRLYRRRERPSPKGMLPLEDWIVPVHYLRRAISFADLKRPQAPDDLSLDALLDRMRPSGSGGTGGAPASDPLASVGRFVGRDAAFYTLDLALKWQRVVVVHGPAGTGKTELAKAFGRWWQATGGIDNTAWVFFHSFEPGLASFGLDGAITDIGLKLFGPDFIGRTQDATQRSELILQLLREHRMLLIWDNFESVRELPDPTGATLPLNATEQERMRAFLAAVAHDGKSGLIVTSRTAEQWLGDVRRVELGGLTPNEAAEMAEDVLRPYPAARAKRQERAFAELMTWLDGHPLSLRLILPQLEQASAATLLATLQGKTAELPAGFVGEGRLASLGASLKYSFDHLPGEAHGRVLALALFEGVTDEDVLALFSAAEGVPARFAGVTKEDWSGLLRRLSGVGVLTELGSGMYGLHPALPSYLTAEWRRLAGEGFAGEHAAAEQALLAAYDAFGGWLRRQIQGGAAETAFALLERQRRTMGRLLGMALTQQHHAAAQALMQPLEEFWRARGLQQEARGWVDRCRSALEDRQGTPPPLTSDAGALWLFAISSEANLAILAGELDRAYGIYQTIRQQLEASPGEKQRQRLSAIYHQLGTVAMDRGDPVAAEDWYRKSLEIEEALGNRPGMATSYHTLGMVAQDRGDLVAAEDWYRKSLEIKEALGNRPGMASSYHQLGILAQDRGDPVAAEDWYRTSLEIKEALGNQPGMAASYHQLGMVAMDRGDLVAAEDWYRKSLEINEALGNRLRMATSYHQLGRVAQDRGDPVAAEAWYRTSLEIWKALGDRRSMAATYGALGLLAEAREQPYAALDWTVRCVALFPEFPHPATRSGPHHLARLTASLGVPALEASWQRCTGASLPDHIRTGVIDMINKSDTA